MKKLVAISTLSCISLMQPVQADFIGFEFGAYQWTPDYSGIIASDTGSTAGTAIDLNNDLGYTDDSHNVLWVSLEHPVPFLPNLKVVSSDLATASDSTLTREIIFDGVVYSADEAVSSVFDTSNTDFTLYYELLDNWVNLDLGVTFRQYDGTVQLTTSPTGSNLNEFQEIDFVLPMLYLAARAELPFTGFYVNGETNFINYQDDSISDTSISLGYESDFGLGAQVGYKSFSLDVDEDGFRSDLEFDGAYASIYYHF